MGNSLTKKDLERLQKADPNDPTIPEKDKGDIAIIRPGVGLAISPKGNIFKTHAADKLELDKERYKNYLLTKEELGKVGTYMTHLKWGMTSVIPIVCTGDSCPFKDSCPYWLIGKAPVGLPCLVEEDILDHYTEAFAEEYNVTENSPTEKLLVQELAELIVYEMRATRVLAKAANAELDQTNIVGFDSEGEAIEQKTIHRAWDIKERCKNRRMKILDALVGTRREQYKKAAALKEKSGDDVASMSAELSILLRELKIRKSNIEDAEIINETPRPS